MWCWPDGLHLSGREPNQGSPLRCLDRLEINRHCADPRATYFRSSLGAARGGYGDQLGLGVDLSWLLDESLHPGSGSGGIAPWLLAALGA